MHRLTASPGGWNPQTNGVIFISQTPAPLVFLTAADTEIQTLAAARAQLPADFPALRVANLLNLQQQLSIDTYAEDVLQHAQVIVVRLLGGRSYWSYHLEVLKETAQTADCHLFVLPGDDRPDPDLISHSTAPLHTVHQLWRYLTEGGTQNAIHALQFIADIGLNTHYHPPTPQPVSQVGLYPWQPPSSPQLPNSPTPQLPIPPSPKTGLLFYRAHYLAGNTKPIDALCQALVKQNLEPVPVFVSSLRDPDVQAEVLSYFQPKDEAGVQLILNTTSFAITQISETHQQSAPLLSIEVPVLQVILSGGTVEAWQDSFQGLSPRDLAMNVALPEVDGRIISRVISFKSVQSRHPLLETEVVGYEPIPDRVEFVAKLAANWIQLQQTPVSQRRVALILANYPNRDGRLANGVGLDTPASCVEILKAMQDAGYHLENVPATSDELMTRLTAGVTNDPEARELRKVHQSVEIAAYQTYFQTLPALVQQGIQQRWNQSQNIPPIPPSPHLPISLSPHLPIPGIQLGNVFVGIQPARGYDLDPSLNYHAPDLEPTHEYLAFYFWVRNCFGAQAIIHAGKHGNLEWLPGKSVGLSQECYPEVALGAMPHLYPFIVNDPGEGSAAKRRAQAVIIDHLTPPLTRAELYGPLQQLECLIDEYYEAQSLDPVRVPVIFERIVALILQENLYQDLGIEPAAIQRDESVLTNRLDGYLCELKESQIRDGLHIFGQCPQDRLLRDLVVAISRHPTGGRLGLTRAITEDLGLEFDPFTVEPAQLISADLHTKLEGLNSPKLMIAGDVITWLEELAAGLVEPLILENSRFSETFDEKLLQKQPILETLKTTPATQKELHWIQTNLLPKLLQTPQEITNLLQGLAGKFVPSGPSGAPTRGRPEVLPTGRNFYSVDIRGLPTETAWGVGRKAAEALIERYTQDNGEYPKTLGLSVWGTSTMRTGGDDIAQALALLGVKPVWDGPSRRVVDFEVLPVSVLARPRVDVTLRISGFFRDAFPNLIDLFDQAVAAVSRLNEPTDLNPLAAQVYAETQNWITQGMSVQQAEIRARYRIFGSKPGAYGAGLQGLIESQNWTDDADLAKAYINWSCYAYTSAGFGNAAPEVFEQRLQQMQVVLHNQDNREHDLLDSDDYYQFQGGLTAAVRAIKGENPQTYFGDHSRPENPKIRRLQEEISRVYRSRVVNPKWVAGMMRHGYKGAFEMAATVDYLFAYDATANCVEDFMYEGVAKAYLLDETVQAFIQQKNPWALRDMAERLLEANARGLWDSANLTLLEDLRSLVLHAEGVIEIGSQ
jgi:cobaltochelatase CobN